MKHTGLEENLSFDFSSRNAPTFTSGNSRALRRAKPISQAAGFRCQNLLSLPMAGLEPARACLQPNGF